MFNVYYEYLTTDYQLFPFDSDISWRNVWGHPCRNITALLPGSQGYTIPTPGRYRITFQRESVDAYNAALEACYLGNPPHSEALSSCLSSLPDIVAYVDCPDNPSNPHINLTGISVSAKEGNDNRNIVPGFSINLYTIPAYYDCFDLIVGGLWLSEEERNYSVLSFGSFRAGITADYITLKIKNTSGSTLTDCYAYILDKACITQSEMGKPLFSINQSDGLNPLSFTEKTAAEISFDNLSDGTVDILVDDENEEIFDVVLETYFPSGRGLACDGETEYQFGDETAYRGVSFILASTLEETDTVDLIVSPGSSIWQIKESGETEWTVGGQGLSLGTLDSDEEIEIDLKVDISGSADSEMNPIEGILQLVCGDESESIGLIAEIYENTDRSLLIRVSIHTEHDYETMMDFGVSS